MRSIGRALKQKLKKRWNPAGASPPPPSAPPTAQSIIAEAMTNRAVYDQMAAKENAVWGKILPALENSEERVKDQEAGIRLRMGRKVSSLTQVARERGLSFQRGLTLGCGAGRLERLLLSTGICRSFHGIDISANAIATAEQIAKDEDLPLTYEVADLNFVELEPAGYDLVVAQTCLHHVLFLEKVAEQVQRALKPDGYLWIHDFVGETQGQYEPKRLRIINELLAILPEKHRANTLNGRTMTKVVTPVPGRLGSPFEKIRSAEIVPVFETFFDIEWRCEFTAFFDLVAPPGTYASYDENDDTRALMEVLHLMEDICIREGIIEPVGGQYLMRPKSLNGRSRRS